VIEHDNTGTSVAHGKQVVSPGSLGSCFGIGYGGKMKSRHVGLEPKLIMVSNDAPQITDAMPRNFLYGDGDAAGIEVSRSVGKEVDMRATLFP